MSSNDETRLQGRGRRPDDETRLRTTPGLSSSSSGDYGRFSSGHTLAGRYRIVRRLGRGGMGEVYLADDLKLAQPVALKFLPQAVESDDERLSQLQSEVRVARQVSHPNVCRIYDLAEADGVHFITMEYVDGEDLASVLRRIGRLPEDRATELSRQLVAGVAAAHARGVIHRDLKPANVMIDADGRVRITDFGLAVAGGSVLEGLAGTPAYMAPEQLDGAPASEKTEIFAVGLILYELFTGRRAVEARTIDELRERHLSRSLGSPAEIVAGLHPAIDRTIMRCLDPDPDLRPASALAIAAALPGADPLAAALAAGETPSPELVAASGGEAATIGPLGGVAWIATVAVLLIASTALVDRIGLLARVPMPLAWDALVDRARTFEAAVGFGEQDASRASGIQFYGDGIRWIQARTELGDRARLFAAARPPVALFWHRSSPRSLVPGNPARVQPSPADPPLNDTGMTIVVLDTTGRLVEFGAVTAQVESAMEQPARSLDWAIFFDAAGLDMAAFTPAVPDWTPRGYADARAAWTGPMPGEPGVELRVEAASHRGVPVNFQIAGPWSRPTRMQPPPVDRTTEIVASVASAVVIPACLVGGLLLARRNLTRGRGDRRGAIRLAVVAFTLSMGQWALGAAHFASVDAELSRLGVALSAALTSAGLYALLYLAIEPQVRRLRPAMLVTWSRLVSGRLRDALFGRDLLVGTAVGLAMTAITFAHYQLPVWFGWPEFAPPGAELSILRGAGTFWSVVLGSINDALGNAVLGGVGIILLRLVVPSFTWAFAIATVVFSFLAARGQIATGSIGLDLALGMLLVVPVLFAIVRYGFVAGIVAFSVHFLTKDVPMTLDTSRLYFADGLIVALLVVAAAGAGFVLARARDPIFGRLIRVD